ncbi:MAG: cyclodeaminase/cyclohydrolase family protein [Spirochaetota bacterium]
METYLKVLDPDDSSAGGGSASAIAGAMAGALLALVARFSRPSLRKKAFSAPADLAEGLSVGSAGASPDALDDAACEGIALRAIALSQRLHAGAREDTEAFQAVRDSYRLPRASEAEKAKRQLEVQAAWVLATRKPLENAEACLALLELGRELRLTVNPNVHSDYSSGIYLARAGLLGCLDNVSINLPSLRDEGLAAAIALRAAACRAGCEALAALPGAQAGGSPGAQATP